MKVRTNSLIGVFWVVVMVAACSSVPETSIVSSSDDAVVVAVNEQEEQKLGEALKGAVNVAARECAKIKKTAKLNRTENSDDGIVAYFDCVVAPAPKS